MGTVDVDWSQVRAENRAQLLPLLPAGGVVAEVGVFRGDFSQRILETTNPRKLHLIDPWVHQEIPLWEKRDDDFHLDNARGVHARFTDSIRERRVVIHMGWSVDILPLFPEGYFDWVYLDGDHRYPAVRQELEICRTRVKPGGLICGHDYIKPEIYPPEMRARFGVVPAVRDFCEARGWELVFQTPDQPRGSKQCPSFVLREKSGNRAG
jgi:hypothetical protein